MLKGKKIIAQLLFQISYQSDVSSETQLSQTPGLQRDKNTHTQQDGQTAPGGRGPHHRYNTSIILPSSVNDD